MGKEQDDNAIYIRWRLDPNTGERDFLSAHKTVTGAEQLVPERMRQQVHPTFGNFIKNYGYEVIQKITLRA